MNFEEKEDLIQELYTNILRSNKQSTEGDVKNREPYIGSIIKKYLVGAHNPLPGIIKQEKSLKDISKALFFSGGLRYFEHKDDFSKKDRLELMAEAITEKGVIRYNGTVFDHMYIEKNSPEPTKGKEPSYNIRLGCVPPSIL